MENEAASDNGPAEAGGGGGGGGSAVVDVDVDASPPASPQGGVFEGAHTRPLRREAARMGLDSDLDSPLEEDDGEEHNVWLLIVANFPVRT